MFCCSSLASQNSIFEKKKNLITWWINTHAHEASSQMARLWLSVEVVSNCTVLFGSRIVNCSQEETFGNLLSRLEEDKFSESDFLFLFFYRPPGDKASSSNKTSSRSGLTSSLWTLHPGTCNLKPLRGLHYLFATLQLNLPSLWCHHSNMSSFTFI